MKSARRPLLSNHNRCWIWGRNAVLETLRANYWTILELLYSDRCEEAALREAFDLAARFDVVITYVRDADITKQCRSEDHQGLAARMPPFPYGNVADLWKQLPENPVLVMLDRIQDSHNFGAIVRSVDVLGMHGVIVGTQEQSPVNSLVARSSAGAVNFVPIVQTESLTATAEELKERGFQIVGASDHATQPIYATDFRGPTVLIIGNEGRGIHPTLKSLCNHFVQIPVLGRVSSLNAAVSAGILFYEVLRQRRDGI
ncbi:23S rRNA (guanosine(2251)-2'-O)-methyltransferase RlmB [Schlesneria sp.]|uniref:23S rRNA (guanosine(2251)-2'-O)-methyltransferase RlmB n=1 Tax=Schlesneria sp. TaxID=2762018 RepID=UPI002EE8DF69